MPSRPSPERRLSKRVALKKRASLLVKTGRQPQRIPCLILDDSPTGFKVGGALHLKQGQHVELISEDTPEIVPCRVMWVGKPGSKHGGEAGLRIKTARA